MILLILGKWGLNNPLVVNEIEDQIDRHLLTREAFLCSQLCTLHPYGFLLKQTIRIEKGSVNNPFSHATLRYITF